jgi:hypothetical protein
MFEGILIGFIILAGCYTLAMWVLARRADVLHGEFIDQDSQRQTDPASSWIATLRVHAHSVRLSADKRRQVYEVRRSSAQGCSRQLGGVLAADDRYGHLFCSANRGLRLIDALPQ